MPDLVYEQLAEALDRLPNGFTRTASGIEIAILKKIFSPTTLSSPSSSSGEFEPADEIAGRAGVPPEEAAGARSTWRGGAWPGTRSARGPPASGWRRSSSGSTRRRSSEWTTSWPTWSRITWLTAAPPGSWGRSRRCTG